jgi:hypothetical protein
VSDFLSNNQLQQRYGMTDSALRHAIQRGRLVVGEDCYQEDRRWQVHVASADRIWGHRLPVDDGCKRCRRCHCAFPANHYYFAVRNYHGCQRMAAKCRSCARRPRKRNV